MKSLLYSLRVLLVGAAALAAAPAAHAQINIKINPPSWGPAVPAGAQYYYIPETQSFYDVPARQYVVARDGRWVRTATLFGSDPATFHPVVVDYVGAQPWVRYDEYRVKYPKHGHPHGMPPGQAKKLYRAGYQDGRRDDRYEDRYEDREEGRGHGKGHSKGHGHGKD